jgi:hypothetical protein
MVAVRFSFSLNLGNGFIFTIGFGGGGGGDGSGTTMILKELVDVLGCGLSSVSLIVTTYEPGCVKLLFGLIL